MSEELENRMRCLELRLDCLELQMKMLERQEFRATCVDCGSHDGKLRYGPIAKELRGEEEPCVLCDECYHKREMDT